MRVKTSDLRRLFSISETNSNQVLSCVEENLAEDEVLWRDLTSLTDFLANYDMPNLPALGRQLRGMGIEEHVGFVQMCVFYTLSRVLARKFSLELDARERKLAGEAEKDPRPDENKGS